MTDELAASETSRIDTSPDTGEQTRPHNREVEDEMICPPPARDKPPRPATEPNDTRRPDRSTRP